MPALALALAGGALLYSTAAAAELGADLAGLLAHARSNNPDLATMRDEADAATQRIQPAGALPDPVLRVELDNVNNYGNGGGFSLLPSKVGETRYTLMQPILKQLLEVPKLAWGTGEAQAAAVV